MGHTRSQPPFNTDIKIVNVNYFFLLLGKRKLVILIFEKKFEFNQIKTNLLYVVSLTERFLWDDDSILIILCVTSKFKSLFRYSSQLSTPSGLISFCQQILCVYYFHSSSFLFRLRDGEGSISWAFLVLKIQPNYEEDLSALVGLKIPT